MLRDKTRGGTVPPPTSEEYRCLVLVIPGTSTREGAKTAPSVTKAETPDWWALGAPRWSPCTGSSCGGRCQLRTHRSSCHPEERLPRRTFLSAATRRKAPPHVSQVSRFQTRERGNVRPSYLFRSKTRSSESHRWSAPRPLNLKRPSAKTLSAPPRQARTLCLSLHGMDPPRPTTDSPGSN